MRARQLVLLCQSWPFSWLTPCWQQMTVHSARFDMKTAARSVRINSKKYEAWITLFHCQLKMKMKRARNISSPVMMKRSKANYIYIWTVNTHFFSADTANLWENAFFVVSSRYWTLFTKPATLIANLPWAETISVLFIQNSWILWAILSKKTNSQKTKCSSRITNNELGIMGMLQCEGKPGFTYFSYFFSVRSSLQISFLNAFCIKISILATLWSNFM